MQGIDEFQPISRKRRIKLHNAGFGDSKFIHGRGIDTMTTPLYYSKIDGKGFNALIH